MSYNIAYSSEVMTGYLQGEIIAPDKQFQAIQNEAGNSLLFSVSTEGTFYVIQEVVASDVNAAQNSSQSNTGWIKTDLTSSIKSQFFPNSTIAAKTFAVSQDTSSGKYSVAVAITESSNDYLFIATSYSINDDSSLALEWKAIPFDAKGKSYDSISIDSIYIFQTTGVPLIVVEIVPSGKSTTEQYFIDSTQMVSSLYWYYYPLPINLTSGSLDLCAGRKYGESVDGIYTCGAVGSTYSVYYQPIINASNPAQTAPTSQLTFDGPATPKCIASVSSAQSGSSYTDLYVTTDEGDLYLFTADNQHNNSIGVKIVTSPLFVGTNSLTAYTTDTKVVVWGINNNHQIFYTQRDLTSNNDLTTWTFPLPILSGVQLISPYINRVNGGNTYFADIGNNQLKKYIQDPVTTCWLSENIMLPVDVGSSADSFDCYMTRLTVTDDTNTLVAGARVKITAKSRVSTYINNEYYVLESTLPVTVKTDNGGGIKVIQKIENLQGVGLIFESESGNTLQINPMDTSAQKVATLNTPEALQNAEVVSDGGTTTGTLVDSNLSDSDYKAGADSIQSLIDAYNNYNIPATNSVSEDLSQPSTTSFKSINYSPNARMYRFDITSNAIQMSVVDNVGSALDDLGDAIVAAAGDLCSWLKSETDYVIQIIEDAANEIWNFVVTIAGEVFTFVIDCVEKAVEALMAVLGALGTIIKDLLQFVKFLFSWGDISLTKDVIKNTLKLYLDSCIDSIADMESSISGMLTDLENKINVWADIPPTAGAEPLTSSQSSYTHDAYSTPTTYLPDYLTANINNARFSGVSLAVDGLEAIITTFVDAIEGEEDVIKRAVDQLNTQLLDDDKYKTMSFLDILQTIMGIVADTIIESAEVLLDATVELIEGLYDALIVFLDTPIWIPVISNLLEDIFGYEISLSLLDIFCYIGAIPGTIVYKLLNGEAPFSEDDPTTQGIINSTSIDELISYFGTSDPDSIDLSKEFYSDFRIPESGKDTIYVCFHAVSSIGALVYAVLAPVNDLAPIAPLMAATSLASAIQSSSFTAAGYFAKPYPIQDPTVSELSSLISDTKTLSSLIFGVMEKKESIAVPAKYAKGVLDIILNMFSFAPLVYHFYELIQDDQNKFTALAYLDDSARVCTYISGIAGGIAAVDPEPDTSEIVALTSSVCAAINGGIQLSACAVDAIID
jgi:hypothetical protein